MRYQPFLYQLEEDIGSLRQGTILCAGNSIPQDLSETQIDLYSSTDGGRSWKFLSHIAHGGKAVPDNGVNFESPALGDLSKRQLNYPSLPRSGSPSS